MYRWRNDFHITRQFNLRSRNSGSRSVFKNINSDIKFIKLLFLSNCILIFTVSTCMIPWSTNDIELFFALKIIYKYFNEYLIYVKLIIGICIFYIAIVITAAPNILIYVMYTVIFQMYLCKDAIKNINRGYTLNNSLLTNQKYQRHVEHSLKRIIDHHIIIKR